jgi:hypothetical protein
VGLSFYKKTASFIFIGMLKVIKNQSNTLILTLNEKKTLASPVFLFRCINDMQRTEVAFIAADISAYPTRYNKFTIVETAGPQTPTSGIIELSPAGYWHYEVYEQTSTTNLDYTKALPNQLEIGKLLVVGTPSQFTRYEQQDKKYTAYTG